MTAAKNPSDKWAKYRATMAAKKAARDMRASDPRDARPDREMVGRHPMFRGHNCSRCRSGERACVRGDPGRCEWPHARND